MNFTLAFCYVLFAISNVLALGAILLRYAIPRSPKLFHVLCVPVMGLSSVAALALAAMAAGHGGALFGVPEVCYRVVFVGGLALTFLTLDVYALYYFLHGRYRRP